MQVHLKHPLGRQPSYLVTSLNVTLSLEHLGFGHQLRFSLRLLVSRFIGPEFSRRQQTKREAKHR